MQQYFDLGFLVSQGANRDYVSHIKKVLSPFSPELFPDSRYQLRVLALARQVSVEDLRDNGFRGSGEFLVDLLDGFLESRELKSPVQDSQFLAGEAEALYLHWLNALAKLRQTSEDGTVSGSVLLEKEIMLQEDIIPRKRYSLDDVGRELGDNLKAIKKWTSAGVKDYLQKPPASRKPAWQRFKTHGNAMELIEAYSHLVETQVEDISALLPALDELMNMKRFVKKHPEIKKISTDSLDESGKYAIIEAAKHYLPELDIAFEPYCIEFVREALFDELRAHNAIWAFLRVRREKLLDKKSKLAHKLKRKPSGKELAEELGLAEQFRELMNQVEK